jgi:hypothetical protein
MFYELNLKILQPFLPLLTYQQSPNSNHTTPLKEASLLKSSVSLVAS